MRAVALIVYLATWLWVLAVVCKAEEPPAPTLTTFYDYNDQVFGMWWVSAGAEYNYVLEANELDGLGWFTVATWIGPAKNSVMSGYTFIIWGNEAVARVRVYIASPAPTPRDNKLRWKILKPVRF